MKPARVKGYCIKCGRTFLTYRSLYCNECKRIINNERTKRRSISKAYSHTLEAV